MQVIGLFLLLSVSNIADSSKLSLPGNDTLVFSGYTWIIKTSDSLVSPGPNYFSKSKKNVWVDKDGYLHLKITRREDKWNCVEINSEKSFGYGRYILYLASRVDSLDKNVFLGMSTYSDSVEYKHREIDIELSRWGGSGGYNGQFVVQPWNVLGNVYRFNMKLKDNYSVHSFNWQKGIIYFQSICGEKYVIPDSTNTIKVWNYTRDGIPLPGDERVKINLWLVNGKAPSDSLETEVVVRKFEFEK